MVNLLATLQKQEGLNRPILDENMIGLIQSGAALNELMQINTSMTEIRGLEYPNEHYDGSVAILKSESSNLANIVA
jgi:hypothetical protein